MGIIGGNFFTREAFNPKLNREYTIKLQELLVRVKGTYSGYELIISEIAKYDGVEEKDLELIKYITVCSILKDLIKQGWTIGIKDDKVELFLKQDDISDKNRIRARMDSERKAQFSTNTASIFINRLESKKKYRGEYISIKNLIGDSETLLERINNPILYERIVEPYIQMVSPSRDEHTGYKISDIWKYFRYTWSIPYKTMPGRNIFYLVRDRSQKYHPVMGIFALGNCILNLTVRDNDIGWTVASIKDNMQRKTGPIKYKKGMEADDSNKLKEPNTIYTEGEKEYNLRIMAYSSGIIDSLISNVDNAIAEIYVDDLPYNKDNPPERQTIDELRIISESLRGGIVDNKRTLKVEDWEAESKSVLFRKKRAQELANLLSAKLAIMEAKLPSYIDWLNELLKNNKGRTAINTALIANRKNKIGSNMMDIIVCGAVPPYNDLLGGKLISILACSPQVIADYTMKYKEQVSEIASRMKGAKVLRDSHLVFLGTTSLYSIGSSQYNRIKIPNRGGSGNRLEFKCMGITEGYGTVCFSKDTTSYMAKMLEIIDGGKRINNVFGEGTSPRFRMIIKGLSALDIKAKSFLKHHSPRIVYSVDLAKNTKEFLLNLADKPEYHFDINDADSISKGTEDLIDYWYERWLMRRITTIDIDSRLRHFNSDSMLLSNSR